MMGSKQEQVAASAGAGESAGTGAGEAKKDSRPLFQGGEKDSRPLFGQKASWSWERRTVWPFWPGVSARQPMEEEAQASATPLKA